MTIAAIRYNNPGNVSLPITGYSGPGSIVGLSGQPGYASFPSVQDGLNAFGTQVTNRINQGYDTIGSLNGIYAEDTGWKYQVSALSGIGVNQTLDPNNPAQMSALQYGIIQQETGKASVFGIDKNTSFGGNTQFAGQSDSVEQPSAPSSDNESEATFSGSENTGDNETTYGTPYGSGQLEGDTSYMQPNFGGGSTDFTSGTGVPTPPQDASGNLIGAQNPDNQTFNFPQNNGVATDFGGQPFDSGITGIPPGSSAGSGMAAGLSPTALTGTAGGVFAGTPLAGLGLGGVAPTGDANTPAIASGTGSGGGTSGGDSSGGVPVDITDPSKIAVDAGSKVQEGAKDLGKSIGETGKAADTTITASTASLTSTGTGWLQYAGNLLFDFIPRAGFGLAAIVLILMGLWLMGKQNEGEKT